MDQPPERGRRVLRLLQGPGRGLTAGVIDAADSGLRRRPVLPDGLAGWAWGELRLDNVVLRPCDVLGRPGQGMELLREHFAHYRPLVAATALGTAAAVHDHVAAHLRARQSAGVITDLRDNALITLGRSYAQVNAALLAALTAQRLSESGDGGLRCGGAPSRRTARMSPAPLSLNSAC